MSSNSILRNELRRGVFNIIHVALGGPMRRHGLLREKASPQSRKKSHPNGAGAALDRACDEGKICYRAAAARRPRRPCQETREVNRRALARTRVMATYGSTRSSVRDPQRRQPGGKCFFLVMGERVRARTSTGKHFSSCLVTRQSSRDRPLRRAGQSSCPRTVNPRLTVCRARRG